VIELTLPKWLRELEPYAGVLLQFAKNPVGFVFSIISLYISSLFLDLFGLASWVVLGVFDSFAYVFDVARLFLISAFGQVGIRILGVVTTFGAELNRALYVLGPAAPFVVALFGSLVFYGLYRGTIALLGEVPGGSTVVDFLRLR
jgi:hypothetical protein